MDVQGVQQTTGEFRRAAAMPCRFEGVHDPVWN